MNKKINEDLEDFCDDVDDNEEIANVENQGGSTFHHIVQSSEYEDDIVNEERTCEVINSTEKINEQKESSGDKVNEDPAIKELEAS